MDRKRFLKKTVAGAAGIGFSGSVYSGLANNPNEAYSKPSDLKIIDIRGATVGSFFDWPIIKIYTNQGIVGLGEVRDAGYISQALMMKPFLIGKNPLDIETILKSISHLTGNARYGGGYSAIDIALMDIAGKALGVPCWKLLGDKKIHDKVEIYADTPDVKNPANLQARVKRRLEMGFKHYKMDLTAALIKNIEGAMSGNVPTQKGLEIWGEYVLKTREIIGYDVSLGADHFGNMTVESGIELGNFMNDSKYSLAFIEDVINYSRWNSVNLNRKITEESRTLTQNGEDIFGLEGFKPWIDNNAINIVQPDLLTSGGMIETKKIADYAHNFGISTNLHNASSPIGLLANVHTSAVLKTQAKLEYHASELPWHDDIVTGIPKPIVQKGGFIQVPDAPGLGIELIDEVLEKYLREDKYLPFKSGLFNPTPEFDRYMSMAEARSKGLIGSYRQTGGPFWYLSEEEVLVYQRGPW